MPWSTIRPVNPENWAYLPCGNASSYPSIAVQGQYMPKMAVATYAKASWFTAAKLNAFIGTVDGNGDTNDFGLAIYDPFSTTYRTYDWSKCNSFDLSGNAAGGPQTVSMGFDSIFGDGAASGTINGKAATTFSAGSVVPDAGQLINVTAVSISAATKVRSYRLSLLRGQLPQYYFGGNRFATEISTGMFSGILTLEQEPGGTVATSAVTITIGGVQFACIVNKDEYMRAYNPSFGTMTNTYSLIDLSAGGLPVTIS